jgi:hypothetical protein
MTLTRRLALGITVRRRCSPAPTGDRIRGACQFMALRVISLQSRASVAFGEKRTSTGWPDRPVRSRMTHFVIFSGSFALVHNSPHGEFDELRASSFSFLAYMPRSRRYKGQVSFDAIRGCWTTEFRFLANPWIRRCHGATGRLARADFVRRPLGPAPSIAGQFGPPREARACAHFANVRRREPAGNAVPLLPHPQSCAGRR